MHTLLDQTRQDEMRIIGCQTLYDFLNNQVGALGVFFVKIFKIYSLYEGYLASCVFHFQLSGFCIEKFKLILLYWIWQSDGTYMFNLEGFIPKLCQLAQEVGEDEREQSLRSAGLQALSSMVFLFILLYFLMQDCDHFLSLRKQDFESYLFLLFSLSKFIRR